MAESRSKLDYAYTPDDDPSHWKLDISDKDHAAAAKAALGKGFRGNKVEIPEKDRASVIRKVNEACRRFGIDPIKTSSLSAINDTRDLNVDGNTAYVDATVGGTTLIILPKGITPEDDDYLKSALWNESFLPLDHALIRAHDLGFDVDDVHFIEHETKDSDGQDEPEPIEPTSSVQPVTEPDPDGNRKMREDLDNMREKNTKRSAAYDPDYFDFMDEGGNLLDEDEVYEYLNHDPEWGYPDKPGTPQTQDQAWEQWSNENHGDSVVMTNASQNTEDPYVMISSDGSIIGSDGQSFSSIDEAKHWLADNDPNRDQYVDASRRASSYDNNTPYVMAFNESDDGWKRLSDQLIDPDGEYADSDPSDVLSDVAHDFDVVVSPQPYSRRWACIGSLDSLRRFWDDVIYQNFSNLDFEDYAGRYGVKPYEGSPDVDPKAEVYHGVDYDPYEDEYEEDDYEYEDRKSSKRAASSDTPIDWYKVITLDDSGKDNQTQLIPGYEAAMNLTVAMNEVGIPARMEPTEDPRKRSSKATAAISVTQQDGSSIVVDDLSGAYGVIYNGPSSFDYEVYDSADAATPFLVDAAGSSDDAVQDISDALNDLASQLHQIAEPTTDPASSI